METISAVLDVLIWILSGSASMITIITIILDRDDPDFLQLALTKIAQFLFIILIGSARINGIADPVSGRGLIGIVAMAIMLAVLIVELNRKLKAK